MMDPVRELKIRAEILHKRVRDLEPAALERLRALPEHKKTDLDALRDAAPAIQRKHCLAAVARELGFAGFDHAVRVLEGDPAEPDVGQLLYDKQWGAFLNHWFASYDEARAAHGDARGSPGARRYLLAYKRHFFLVERAFIEALSLDPDDPDWEAIGWDWARPRDRAARARLYAKLLRRR